MTEETQDLLFELGTEELPPVALKRLSEAFSREFIGGLEKAKLSHGEVRSFAAPRRLAILVRDCLVRQPDTEMQRRGPAVQAAFDDEGNPTKAAEGFARSCGATVDQCQRLITDKGEWLVFHVHETGKSASALLPGIAEIALNRLPIPKRMRWGASEAQFVRPVHWLVFLLGDEVVPCELLDAVADRKTHGHRFHHPEAIRLERPGDYAGALRETGFVLADFAERRAHIRDQVIHTAETLGGRADLDDALLDEVTALNEWPVPIAAGFEERFLEVPHEALILTMKKNQKYFPLFDGDGRLMNHFITIANIDSPRPEVIREGNERVVRPRLADAMFFWEQDGRQSLKAHTESLKSVVFQQKLGSMYDKSERVAALAAHIAAQNGGDAALAERAGRLSRCDLMTHMVGEFADMQGIMGRYQAGRDGEPEELAQAMDEFYMPRFSGDQLPESATGTAISLAERLDTLVGIFGIGMKPTGDKDPFALRRAALGALRILKERGLSLDLHELLEMAATQLGKRLEDGEVVQAVYDFMLERLKGLYADDGMGAELFEAVAAVRPRSVTDFDQRIRAVAAFRKLPEAEALAAANKRIRNILRKTKTPIPDTVSDALLSEAAERDLMNAVAEARPQVEALIAEAAYGDALSRLARLRETVDSFFDQVLVMAEDPTVRDNRLALLKSLGALFLETADISRLPG